MTKKIFWKDAYETKFTAKVKSITEEGIILDQTLFYPESGNQVSDIGLIKTKENNFKVETVTKEKDKFIHHISSDFKNKINIGDLVRGEIDWDYRYGVMKAHSSQHIFSAVIKKKYNIDTIRAILNFEDVYIQLATKIEYEVLKDVLIEVNKLFTINNLNLKTKTIPHIEAKKISEKIRSDIPNKSQIRLVEIENLDLVCCGGTHVKNSIEIGTLFIYEFKKGNEIRYVVGNKALEMSSNLNENILSLANEINSPVTKLKELLKKRLDFLEHMQKQQTELSFKLLDYISKSPIKKIDNTYLFFINFDVDIRILQKWLDKFPSNSLIVVKFHSNKIRIISLNEKIDSENLLQQLIQKFGGKGGGNSKSSQGLLEKMPKNLLSDIESILSNN